MGFVTPCDTWCELSVGTWENVFCDTSKGGLLFMITWKTIVFWYWLGDLKSFFFFFFSFSGNRCSQRLSNRENFLFDCKLENRNIGGEYRRWKHLFNGPSVYSHFQGCSLLITSMFLLAETRWKNTVDKELFKTNSGSEQLYLASFLSPGLQWMQRFACWKWTVKAW